MQGSMIHPTTRMRYSSALWTSQKLPGPRPSDNDDDDDDDDDDHDDDLVTW